jgi:glycosyltransferase involved in cell wall biosynthesis
MTVVRGMGTRRVVAISDYCTQVPPDPAGRRQPDRAPPRALRHTVAVAGGYLERLPLAMVRSGLADAAEVWSFAGRDGDPTGLSLSPYGLGARRFRADGHAAPYGSADMLDHIAAFGAPDILCVWGLGVTEEVLAACRGSLILYNSLDVEAIRVPPEVSRHVDIFLTASPAQTREVQARHPDALVAMLPVGPDFASPVTFFPIPGRKEFDVIYVAAAQPYKRHDILFDALAALPPKVRALCVMGYGEAAASLRAQAADLGLDVTFVGPPGVSHAEVNRLMNRARIGLVCGVNDGAPAILTEYMLAGLPVLANADLACGLHYIRPETGRAAPAGEFAAAIDALLADRRSWSPRDTVLRNWTWPHSMARLSPLIDLARARRQGGRRA